MNAFLNFFFPEWFDNLFERGLREAALHEEIKRVRSEQWQKGS